MAARIAHIALTILILLGLPAGFSKAAAPETIVLATSPNPLLSRKTDKGVEGFLGLVMEEAFRRMGQKVEVRLMPWARCVEETRTGAVDGVFALFHSPDRDADFLFTGEPLSEQTEVLFVRRDSLMSFNGDFAALSGKKVAAINRGIHSPRLRQALAEGWHPEIVGVNSLESAAAMLAAGRVDLVPAHREVFQLILQEQHLSDQIIELSPPVESVKGYLALTKRKDLQSVATAFDAALRSMKADGTYDSLYAADFKSR